MNKKEKLIEIFYTLFNKYLNNFVKIKLYSFWIQIIRPPLVGGTNCQD